jgi:hypothetical protein
MTEIMKTETAADKALGADPGPLGLFAFAFTTFLLSSINADLLPSTGVSIVIPLAITWGGVSQFIAGAFEMRKGNTFGFTAFTSYGAFWVFFALVNILGTIGVIKVDVTTLAAALFFWGLFSLLMWIPAMMANIALNAVFLFLWITLFLLAFGAWNFLGYGDLLTMLGGYVGLLTGVCAAYAGLAGVVNSMGGHLPVGKGIGKRTKKVERDEEPYFSPVPTISVEAMEKHAAIPAAKAEAKVNAQPVVIPTSSYAPAEKLPPFVKPTQKPAPAPVAKPAPKLAPAAKSAPVAKPAAKPAPAVNLSVKPVAKPAPKPAPAASTRPSIASASKPASKMVPEPDEVSLAEEAPIEESPADDEPRVEEDETPAADEIHFDDEQ